MLVPFGVSSVQAQVTTGCWPVGFSHTPGRRPVSPLAWQPPAKVDKSLPMLDGDDDGGGDGDGDGDGDCDGDENG